MKISKYNLFCKFKRNEYILHNMISKETVLLNKKEFKDFKNMSGDSDFCKELLNSGFYIPNNQNEIIRIREENRQACQDYSNLNITLVPTFACNFKCKYCYQNGLDNSIMKDEDIEVFIEFIKRRLSKHKSKSFHLSWFGGEPLLVYDIIYKTNKKILDFCVAKNIEFSSSISTNLSLIDDKKAKLLKDVAVTRIETTLVGNEKTHNDLRVCNSLNSFECTKKGIMIAAKYFTVMVNMNFCKSNFHDIKNFLKHDNTLKQQNIYLNFSEIINYKQNRFQVKQYKNCELKKLKLYCLALKNNWKICDITNFCSESIYCSYYHVNSFSIDNQLNVYKCAERFDENTQIGIIDKHSYDCKYNANYKDLYELEQSCLRCQFLPYCNGGCQVKRQQNIKPCPEELTSVYKYLKLFVRRRTNDL